MSTLPRASVGLFLVATFLLAAQPATAQVVQEFATGLLAPIKLLAIPGGGMLVAEAGTAPNTGRVSLVDRDARRFTVIDGLPSGFHLLGPDAGGPSGLLLTSTRLYVVIGAGDTAIPGAAPATEILNPNPTSPLFSSVLLFEFAEGPLPMGFTLPSGNTHARIAAGEGVYIRNERGAFMRVSMLADIPNSIPEPRPTEPRHVRISNPFGIVGDDNLVSVVDASRNVIWNIPNVPASQISILGKITGFAFAPVAACSTFGVGLKLAMDAIRSGDAKAVVVGATDSPPNPLTVGAFHSARVLSAGSDPSVPLT